jgi:hypothetical protein
MLSGLIMLHGLQCRFVAGVAKGTQIWKVENVFPAAVAKR